MKWKSWLLASLVLTAGPATPHAQRQSQDDIQIQLGGIDLTLGTRQEDALRKLSAVYNVRYDDSFKQWTVSDKVAVDRPIGAVSFRMERLVWVQKEWFDWHDETAAAHALAIRNAIQAVAGPGRPCKVSAEPEAASPPPPLAAPSSVTVIQCGRHRVEMVSSREPRWIASVREILE